MRKKLDGFKDKIMTFFNIITPKQTGHAREKNVSKS